ncbi:MAG: hypothetical protein HF967_07040, partial [Methanosarcinales archaeon]|nr:hypothetical protein [Methanosarcinales archaeon]
MKKILLLNIFAFISWSIQLSAQCSVVVSNVTEETCVNSSDASATATGVGSGQSTYLWSNGQTSATATNLTTGTYTVIATDANGCTSTATATVTLNPEGVWLMISSTPVTCNGGNDGTAHVSVMTGVAPFIYQWDDPAGTTTADPVNLTAGQYRVTVTDVNGCSNYIPIVVEEPTAIVILANSSNETCFGDANGSASITTSGGTGQKTYSWSTGATTSSIGNLSAGNYGVTATDENGCTSFTTITVSLTNPQITLTGTSTSTTCNGGNNGTASVTVNSGNGPFTYLWSDGQTTANATGLTDGNYIVTVTGANGCATSTTIMVTEPTQITTSITPTHITCFGNNNGIATATSNGGTGQVTYAWSNGGTGGIISNLAAGTYSVTATDANGCTQITTTTITEPTPLTATSTGTNVTTVGANDGTATANPSGGTAPYTYLWSNGATTQTISNLAAGTYTVTITDANGCTTTTTVIINQPIILITTSTPATCGSANDGTAMVSASGGVPSYSYLWSDGQTTATATGLAAGIHSVTVTDANGNTSTTSVVVTEISNVIATASSSNETCVGSADGHVSVSTSGGVGQMTFLWSNGATTSTVNNLSVGTYTVTVTDQNGCTASASTTIELSPEGIWVDVTTTPVLCFGENSGNLSTSVTTGVPPYSYAWSNGATTPNLSNLIAGTYTVSVTDANGCVGIFTTEITQPTQITGTITSTNVNCGATDGTASVMINGGTPGYTYSWSNGATTQNISGLAAGTYTVTATDTKGCMFTTSTVVNDNNTLLVTSATPTNPTTAGGTDGTINIEISGGTTPYTYLWSNGSTTQDISGLSAGCYTVTISDANGCSISSTTCLTDPSMLTVVVTTTDNGCMGNNMGTVTAIANDGTSPYTYMWTTSTGFPLGTTQTITGLTNGTYLVTVTDTNGVQGMGSGEVTGSGGVGSSATSVNITCNGDSNGSAMANGIGGAPGLTGYQYNWSNGAITQNISNLPAGTYTVTVTDQTGCTSTSQVTITEPTTITTAGTTGTNPTTAGGSDGSIDLVVSGGTPGYTFLWSNGAMTEDISGLSAGCYTVTITDANNCTAIAETCLTDPLISTLVVTVTTTDNGCMGNNMGTATANPSGGTPPYTYMWTTSTGFPLGTDQTIMGLTNGTYFVTVTDANGVQEMGTGEVTGSGGVGSSATAVNITCNGDNNGSAMANGIGGAPGLTGYQYNWSNGATTQTISNLTAGTYTVTVTDQTGCTSTSEVTITEPTTITTAGTTGTNPTTAGGNDGSIDLVVSGGTPGYTFLWSNGATTEDISGLSAGCYTVTITDANSCTAISETCIIDPPMFAITVTAMADGCAANDDGMATATVSGGTPIFHYEWKDAQGNPVGGDNQTVAGLSAGMYFVTVTDANNLTATESIQVVAMPGPDANATAEKVTCNSFADGEVSAVPTGGLTPYSYAWSDGTTMIGMTNVISNLSVGAYTVTVTDAMGCTDIAEVAITEDDPIGVNQLITPLDCNGGNNAAITITASGGTPDYSYEWNTSSTADNLSGLEAGVFTVTVTDQNGCFEVQEIMISAPPAMSLSLDDNSTTCDEAILLNAVVNSGANVSWYEDLNGATIGTGATLNYNLSSGENMLYAVAELNGCQVVDSVMITQQGVDVSVVPAMAICQGSIAQLSATNNNPSDVLTYEWTPVNIFTAGVNTSTPTLNTSATGITEVYLATENQYGCTQIDTINITVQDTTANFIETQQCTDLLVNFANTNPNGPTEYIWNFGDGSTPMLATAPSHLYPSSGTYTIMMILPSGMNNAECLPDTISKEIQVADAPIFNTDFTLDYDPCTDDSTTLVFTDVSTNVLWDVVAWDWEISNGTISNNQEDSTVITQSGTYTASLVIYAEDGCVDSLTKEFDINVLTLNIQDTIIACSGEEDIALNPFGNPDYQYNWS